MFGGPRAMLEQEARKPKRTSITLRRLAGYFKKYTPVLLFTAVLIVVGTWAQVLAPELIGQAADCYITPAVTSSLAAQGAFGGAQGGASQTNCWYADLPASATTADYLAGLGGLVLRITGLFVLVSVFAGLQFFLMSWAGQHVLRALREEVFDHVHRLSLGYYGKNEAGDVMSRITNDTDTLQQAMSFALIQVLSGVLLLVWIVYKMLTLNWAYALLSMIVLPIMAVATVWFSSQARKAFRRARVEIGNVNANLQESISGVREVQAFSREEANIESFRESNAANRDANIRAVSYTSALAPVLEALGYVAIAVVVGVGGALLLRGQSIGGQVVSLGLIITFLGYAQRFNQPIQQVSVLWANIQSAIAGGERIFGLLDEVPDIQEKPTARPMPAIQGRVVFADVKSEYNPGEPVLRGVNLTAEPGQIVAIVGPTGAGKTTIINLIPRFYDVSGGSVSIDGIDVRDVTLGSLRQQIGMVLQDSFLFGDTVMNNIRFGRPDASDEEVIVAAKLARADAFIASLPDGYATILGERGSGLSNGQRQLLAIARAALANPRILILDEATSSVDTRTERQIQAALETIMAGRTTFVIAHRLSTIRHADQVLVLDQGQIIERGRHDELLAQKGFYYNLYRSQFLREEETAAPVFSGNGRQAAVAAVAA
ncbi:MAG: ABC transporter ATP-binding protein/permease [Caldilineales bacterium]|nr:ABC transporter ATP-binding protein/permease [Caldilineales bacterium]